MKIQVGTYLILNNVNLDKGDLKNILIIFINLQN